MVYYHHMLDKSVERYSSRLHLLLLTDISAPTAGQFMMLQGLPVDHKCRPRKSPSSVLFPRNSLADRSSQRGPKTVWSENAR